MVKQMKRSKLRVAHIFDLLFIAVLYVLVQAYNWIADTFLGPRNPRIDETPGRRCDAFD
jgi:hypothetical protein